MTTTTATTTATPARPALAAAGLAGQAEALASRAGRLAEMARGCPADDPPVWALDAFASAVQRLGEAATAVSAEWTAATTTTGPGDATAAATTSLTDPDPTVRLLLAAAEIAWDPAMHTVVESLRLAARQTLGTSDDGDAFEAAMAACQAQLRSEHPDLAHTVATITLWQHAAPRTRAQTAGVLHRAACARRRTGTGASK